MKVDVNVVLKTLDGKGLKDNDGNDNVVDATLKMAIINALLSPVQKESGVDKVNKYELAKRVYSTTVDELVELSAEDITLIKNRIGEVYPPLIVGQIYNLLEQKET